MYVNLIAPIDKGKLIFNSMLVSGEHVQKTKKMQQYQKLNHFWLD